MPSSMRTRFLPCLYAALLLSNSAWGGPVTLPSLLGEMVDLQRLTRMPDPAYTTRQFSSYDRNAKDPLILTDDNWFANGDRGHHLRTEERNGATEWVMMDAEGPGAVVRVWSANPADAGTVRFYLDGAETPEIEMPLSDMLGGQDPRFPAAIAGEHARGWNSYLPIPYAKHCKITASQPDFYYVVNYRTYAAGTPVETYSAAAARDAGALIQATAAALAAPQDIAQAYEPPLAEQPITWSLAPGETGTLSPAPGPGVVGAIRIRVAAEDLEIALRACLFEVRYDGETAPAIQAPLGDFFGTAPGPRLFQSLPCGVLEDGAGTLYAHWSMPYRKSMAIAVTNHGATPVSISGTLQAGPATVEPERLYLHAKWRAVRDLPTRPRQDWNFASLNGAGRFAGVMLHVSNPVKAWWGEGDEKIYVDGESFPSFFGTGSEDYFGYAWCCNEAFDHAYHNQPRCDGPGNYGQTCVSRFHIMDDIPYMNAFKFDMEVWHWADVRIAQSAITWWYAKAGGTDNFETPDPAMLTIPEVPPLPAPRQVAGAIEGESMEVVSATGGQVTTQDSDVWEWSNARQLWWIDAAEGDRLEVAFDAPEAGDYDLLAVFTRAPDYGIVKIVLGDKTLAEAVDLYGPGVEPTPEIALGSVTLGQGRQTLSFIIAGHNEKAIPRNMFGLDYIRLVKK